MTSERKAPDLMAVRDGLDVVDSAYKGITEARNEVAKWRGRVADWNMKLAEAVDGSARHKLCAEKVAAAEANQEDAEKLLGVKQAAWDQAKAAAREELGWA